MQALESPEMRSLMALDQKGRLDSRYAALFKALKLPPAQLDKLKQLLVDKQSAPMDVFAEARAQGLTGPENAAQIRALLQATNQEIDENVRATLGDAAFEQYQQYERTLPQRNVVDQLANRLSYSDDPLSAQQTEQLVALLAASSPPNTAGGPTTVNTVRFAAVGSTAGASPMMIGGPSTPITSEAVNNASSLLSAAQLEALRQIQAEQQAQQQMSRTLQQSFGGPGNSTNISVPGNTAPSTPARPPND